jgi:hypothetical protein
MRLTDNSSDMKNGGMLEKAQRMATPSSAKTTNLYDRSSDQITLDDVERIAICSEFQPGRFIG